MASVVAPRPEKKRLEVRGYFIRIVMAEILPQCRPKDMEPSPLSFGHQSRSQCWRLLALRREINTAGLSTVDEGEPEAIKKQITLYPGLPCRCSAVAAPSTSS